MGEAYDIKLDKAEHVINRISFAMQTYSIMGLNSLTIMIIAARLPHS